MTPAAGSILGGRYRLTSPIAAGGMGEVWRAVDELLGRQVAVKLLGSHVAADPSFRDRFRAEARITAALADPGIAQVYDYGESDGSAYLVMELVIGEPLSAILARHGALDPQAVLDVIQQTARGLYAAHRAGVIHRDIKPGNLLITRDGQVKITDFGIARALETAPLTRTGTVLGTVQYVSPEQATGSALTSATDIYSLGVVAYECLAGRPPFVAETQVAVAVQHINAQPPPLPATVPPAVRDLVFDMLAKEPSARPPTGPRLLNRVAAIGRELSGTPEAPPGSGAAAPDEASPGPGSAALRVLTDPDGFPGSPGRGTRTSARPRPSAPVAPGRGPGRTGPRGGGPGRSGRRRGMAALAVALGSAAVAGAGVLAFNAAGPVQTPSVTSTASPPSAVTSSARPTRRSTPEVTVRASYPVASATPAASAKPSAVPSATVSTSAPPTQKPSPDPSPSPTPTPTPTSDPTPSETPAPSVTPTDTSPPDEVGA